MRSRRFRLSFRVAIGEDLTVGVEHVEHQGAPRFFMSLSPELPHPSFAKIVVRTPGEEGRDALRERLRGAAANGLAPAARVRATQLVFSPYSPFPVAFRASGPDVGQVRAIADRVRAIMLADPMMRTVNTDWGELVPTLHLVLTRAACARRG